MADKKEHLQMDCEIIKELLPLYHDGVVHENTETFVQAHLAQCAACRKEYAALCDEFPLEEVEISTKEQFTKMIHTQKRKHFSVTILVSIASSVLLLGVFFFCTLFGYPLSSEEVQLKAGLNYNEEAYLNQSFELHVQRTNGLPLYVSSKTIFDENGKPIGAEITPKKHLFNIVHNSDEYVQGYSRANDGIVPDENFDYTITVKFFDKTLTYSMAEEGLFVPQK